MKLRAQASRLWRSGWVIILSLSIAYGLLLLWVHVRESIIRSRSEAMYAEFLRLEPGKTTKRDIETLRTRFAGSLSEDIHCKGADCDYTIGDLWGHSAWSLLAPLAHDHMPTSELTLRTTGDFLSRASFSVGVLVPKGYGTREERKRLSDPNYVPYSSGEYLLIGRAYLTNELPELCCDARLNTAPEYRIWGPSACTNCVAILVSALPSLAPAKRAQVFDIDFDCMTRWSTCTDKEDIMPTAGREKAKERAAAGQ
jgi:hypothetical protein